MPVLNSATLQRTPLFDRHTALSARLVPFAGWEMPVAYGGILQEHEAVRKSLGIFDISHMGQLLAEGPDAQSWLETQLTNRVSRLGVGEGQYTLLLREDGGVLDDLIVYRLAAETFLLVVNAARVAEDVAALSEARDPGVRLTDLSPGRGGLALQGPRSAEAAAAVFPAECALPERHGVAACGDAWICRTGYTGEDGFEIFAPAGEMASWWDRFLEAGAAPCGLGARDTLRLEMGYPLNGSDLSPEHTPLEAGLGAFVDLEKGPFRGREALLAQRERGLPAKLAGLMADPGSPPLRAGYPVWREGREIGVLASGCLSPSLRVGIGMAYLPPDSAAPGTSLELEIRGRRHPARVVRKPFYRKPSNEHAP